MDQFFTELFSNSVATGILLASFIILVIAVTTMYAIAFFQGRAISFWPPKIGKKTTDSKQVFELKARTYFEKPLMISSRKMNRRMIDSDFLLWEQCTIMVWVYVPPKGQDLRDTSSKSPRYLIAHHTGRADEEKWIFFNRFALRYSRRHTRWEVTFSNSKAEELPSTNKARITDGLETGWHQFLIAWDRSKPKLVFLIDEDRSGSDLITSEAMFSFWPEQLAGKVSVGAGMSNWKSQYCETRLFQMVVFDGFLEPTDAVVKEHLSRKPSS